MLSRLYFLGHRRKFPHEVEENPSPDDLVAAERGRGGGIGVQGPEEPDNTKLASCYEGQASDV